MSAVLDSITEKEKMNTLGPTSCGMVVTLCSVRKLVVDMDTNGSR
jgi:hypothetical protein